MGSGEGEPIDWRAIFAAEAFINRIGDDCLRPYVYPTEEGGVQVEFFVRNFQKQTTYAMDVRFTPAGRASAVIYSGGGDEWYGWEQE